MPRITLGTFIEHTVEYPVYNLNKFIEHTVENPVYTLNKFIEPSLDTLYCTLSTTYSIYCVHRVPGHKASQSSSPGCSKNQTPVFSAILVNIRSDQVMKFCKASLCLFDTSF